MFGLVLQERQYLRRLMLDLQGSARSSLDFYRLGKVVGEGSFAKVRGEGGARRSRGILRYTKKENVKKPRIPQKRGGRDYAPSWVGAFREVHATLLLGERPVLSMKT